MLSQPAPKRLLLILCQEGQTGRIPLQDTDPDTVAAMLRFLYTGNYGTDANTMQFHLEVYTLADQLDITKLKTLSENKFKIVAESSWNDATFPAYVKIVYDNSPPGSRGEHLRSIVVKIAAEHAKELFKLDTGFRQMMEEVAEFGADLSEVLSGVRSLKYDVALSSGAGEFVCHQCSYQYLIGEPCPSGNQFCPNCSTIH